MKPTFKQIALVLVLAGMLMARTLKDLSHGPDDPTLDGRFWADLSQAEKVMLIEGISEGIMLTKGDKAWQGSISVSSHHSNEDYVKEMDILYADPANSLIPTYEIYSLSTQVFNGASEDFVKNFLQGWRAETSKGSNK